MKHLVRWAGSVILLGAAVASGEGSSLPQAANPLGRWVTASGNLEVEVAPCGEALCGTVVRVLANRSMSREGGEMKAADPRDPMGMQVLSGFVPTEFGDAGSTRVPTEWSGTIYNRENAKTYRCVMSIGPAGELLLHAYVGLRWFGRTSAWTRAGVALGEAR